MPSSYCEHCDGLRNTIATIQASYMAGNHEATETEYQQIKEDFAYDRNKLDVKSAERADSLTGLEKSFLASLESKPADKFYITGEWIYQHFIDVNYLVSKFLKNGYIEFSKSKAPQSMTVTEMKGVLKANGLKTTGTKSELAQTLSNLTKEQIEKAFGGKEYIRLTEKGIKEVGVKGIISRDGEMESRCISLILENKLAEAFQLVGNYESEKLIGRGIGTDWTNAKYEGKLTMKTKLPFNLPEQLAPHEKEMRAASIYCNMMGSNNAKRLFLSRNKIDFDSSLLDSPLHAMQMMALGVSIPKDFNVKGNAESKWVYTENAKERFLEELNKKEKQAKLKHGQILYEEQSSGLLNFTYNHGCQIGRIKFGKRTSGMQIINMKIKRIPSTYGDDIITFDDFVDWHENESLETYIELIDKWLDSCKVIDEMKDLEEKQLKDLN